VSDKEHEIASAIRDAARHLGTNDAATPMGAIELLGSAVKDGSDQIATALGNLGDLGDISLSVDRLAEAVNQSGVRVSEALLAVAKAIEFKFTP
jgi:hypothetical protein